MQVLNVTAVPIYLPFDKAPVPFGDPLEGVTCTAAAPGVFTVPGGYVPVNGDAVALTFFAGGSLPAPLTVTPSANAGGAGVPSTGFPGSALAIYYVVGAAGETFSLSVTKGGAAITTTTVGANIVLHLMSGQVDGVTLPFKAGYTVLAENNTAGALTLQGASDVNAAAPGQGYNPPGGPGAFATLAVIPAGGAALVQLSTDWVKLTSAGPLVLQQN